MDRAEKTFLKSKFNTEECIVELTQLFSGGQDWMTSGQ